MVYEGHTRNPMPIFNEKAVLRLGRGMQTTGRLNEDGIAQALTVMHRYHAVARAMGAEPFEVLATAAVRDAENGPAFVAALRDRMPGVPIQILSGVEEAAFSADGMLCGIPGADGVLADIGGGSLEVVRLIDGTRGSSQTLRLGVIRLAERSGGDPVRARPIAEADLQTVPWLGQAAGRDLYLVGGAWRALARIHMAQTGYPLNMVHHYTIGREEARELADPAVHRRRAGCWNGCRARRAGGSTICRSPPWCCAGCCARPTVRRVVFSASGLREGWFMRRMPAGDPRAGSAAERGLGNGARHGRDPSLPPALVDWTRPLFAAETPASAKLREATCWMSDIGSHDHPEFRAEQAFLRVLRQPGVGLDHHVAGVSRAGGGAALRGGAGRGVPAAGAAAARLGNAPVGRRCWGSRCGWPTRCRPAPRRCWRGRGCGSRGRAWCCACGKTAACSPARA